MKDTTIITEIHWASIALLLACVQLLTVNLDFLFSRQMFSPSGLVTWPYVSRTKKIFSYNNPVSFLFNILFSYPNFVVLIVLRLMFIFYLIYAVLSNNVTPLPIILLCTLGLIINLRTSNSSGGSDRVITLVLITLSIFFTAIRSDFIRNASLIFISFQASLAYFTSGIYKIIKRDWRNGVYLKNLMETGSFGNKNISRRMNQRPMSYKIASLSIIILELLLSVAVFCPTSIFLYLLSGGVLLHLSISIVMGLNNYFWAFLPLYPFLYLMNLKIHNNL